MPACSECSELVGGTCLAELRSDESLGERGRPAPLSACPIPIVDSYVRTIRPDDSVLEIGCGTWSELRDRWRDVGATYDGIDPLPGAASVATRIENLADLSFADRTFDLVVGTQSMEHWGEYGCSLDWGLHQCFRVCKPGGRVMMNVPIHFHGTSEFMLGRLDEIRAAWGRYSNSVTLEKWGHPSSPIPEYFPYPGYLPLRRRPAYVLDVRAVKDRELPPEPHNAATTGVLARLQAKPMSYVAYSACCRVLGIAR